MKRHSVSLALMSTLVGLLVVACAGVPAESPKPAPSASALANPTVQSVASAQPAAAAVPSVAQAPTASAQSSATSSSPSFPQAGKPVTLIVPYAAGGGSDIKARIMAPLLEKDLGTTVQIVNKPGASSQTGTTELALAKPDGYTIGSINLPNVITAYLDPERKATFTRSSFQLLAMQDADPGIVAVRAETPYRTFADVLAAAKANPGKITLSTSGLLSHGHLAAITTENMAGVKFALVNFDGSAPAKTALMGGHIEVYYGNLGDMTTMVQNKQVRILALMDRKRSAMYPAVPTFEELGLKIYSGIHCGMAMPAGAPKAVVDRLTDAMENVITDKSFVDKMNEMGYMVTYMGPDEYSAFWSDYEERIKPVMAEALRKS